MCLNSRRALVIEVGASRLNISLAFLLATIVDEEVVKTKTSFFTVPDTRLSNNLFDCSYNM